MKNAGFIITHFAAAMAATTVQAQSLEISILETINPNALAQVLIDQTAKDLGQTQKYQIRADDIGLLCLGRIGLNPVEVKTMTGERVLAAPITPEIARLAYDTDAADKASQDRLRGLLENRSDLAYLEMVTQMAPSAQQISGYLSKTYHAAPLDAHSAGTEFNDGSTRTGLLVDQALLEKFAADHAGDIADVTARHRQDKAYQPVTYSHCGPRFAPSVF